MSIKTLQFCEPFFTIKAVQDEQEYKIGDKSIVINLSEKEDLMIKDKPLYFKKSTIVTNITIQNLQQVLVVEAYEKYGNPATLFEKVKKVWPIYYEMTKNPRHLGLLVWRSSKERVFGHIDVNLCAIAAKTPTGPHKDHPVKFREVHTQLMGYGKMKKFQENDCSTIYQELPLAPGVTHESMYDENIDYPWHDYESITDGIYMPIEILPEIQG